MLSQRTGRGDSLLLTRAQRSLPVPYMVYERGYHLSGPAIKSSSLVRTAADPFALPSCLADGSGFESIGGLKVMPGPTILLYAVPK